MTRNTCMGHCMGVESHLVTLHQPGWRPMATTHRQASICECLCWITGFLLFNLESASDFAATSVTYMSESHSSYYMKLYASGHRHADRRTVAPVLGHIKAGLGFPQGSVSYPCPHINVTTMFHHCDGISQVMSRAWYSVLKGSIFVSLDQTRAPVLDIQSQMLTHNLNQLLFKGEEGEWKEGFILCTLLLSCLMFWQVYACTDEWTKRTFFNDIKNTYRKSFRRWVYAVHMLRAAEQRKVFRLLGLSLNDAVHHRLILVQQKCKGHSLLPTFLPNAAAPTQPTLGPKVLLAALLREHKYECVCFERVCLCGVFCIVLSRSEVKWAR